MSNMFKSNVMKSWSAAVSISKMSLSLNIILSLVLLVVTVMLFREKVQTVVVPPTFTEEITMIGNEASEAYKSGWALFTANLVGNVSSRNAKFIMDTLRKMFPISRQAAFEEQMRAQLQVLKARSVAESFTALDLVYDSALNKVWVYGDKKTISYKSGAETTQRWTYEVQIKAVNGAPKIKQLIQYEGKPKINRPKK